MEPGELIVIGVSLFLAVWYMIFAIINRRRGLKTYDWLTAGVKRLGTISKAEWIGSSGSGARIVVEKPEKPFGRVEVIYLLASREILPLWIYNQLRGKRDEIILKASLRHAPQLEVEVARPGNRELEKIIKGSTGKKNYARRVPADDSHLPFEILSRGPDSGCLEALERFLARYPQEIQRISLQRQTPHLILRSQLPGQGAGDAPEFFEALQTWAAEI